MYLLILITSLFQLSQYVVHTLKSGCGIQFNNINPGRGSNVTSNINSGWGTNITSNEVSACTHIPPYILPALQLSDTRLITNNLRDDLICPITRDVFKDPILANDGNTYEKNSITTWLKNKHKSILTNQRLYNNILTS